VEQQLQGGGPATSQATDDAAEGDEDEDEDEE
jgi:hypothetical protein